MPLLEKMDQPEFSILLDSLKNGGICALPGDTVYGISCDATNEEAVKKVIQLKGRDPQKSFIILVASDAMLERFVKDVPEVAWQLIDTATEPMTIIYPQGIGLADGVAAADGSIAIRITTDPISKKLIQQLKRPLLSTSANLSGQPTAMSFQEIHADILEGVDHVVTSAAPKGNKASSIIRIGLDGEFDIIRK